MSEQQQKSASEQLAELIAANKEHLAQIKLDAAKSGTRGYDLALTTAINVGGEQVSKLHFRAHTVGDVQDPDDKMHVLIGKLTRIRPEEALQLSTADFDAAEAVLEGFHLRRAVGGPAQ